MKFVVASVVALVLTTGWVLAEPKAAENPGAFIRRVLEISTDEANPDAVLDSGAEQQLYPNVNEATQLEIISVSEMRNSGRLEQAMELANRLIRDLVAVLESRTSSRTIQEHVANLQNERILILKKQAEFGAALRETSKFNSLCIDLKICSPATVRMLAGKIKQDPRHELTLTQMLLRRKAELDKD